MQPEPPLNPRTHVPAYIGLACSLVLCCPVTSLIGVLVGWLSLRAIDASGGRLGGRRLALSAVILGLAMLPFQFLLLSVYNERSAAVINDGLSNCVVTVFDIDGDDRKKALEQVFVRHRGRYPTPALVDAFVDDVTGDLGGFRSVSIVQRSVQSNFTRSLHDVALVFTFDDTMATGGAVCELIMNPTSFHLEVRLVELEINLSDGRLLRLPSSPTGSTTTSDEDAGAGEADVETDVETEETDQE
jgi:hypothetical protein